MPSPASLFEESFEVLPTCSHQCLTVDTPEPSQAKAPHPMPLLAFSKERFNPDATLAHGFLVGWCLVVALHTFKIASMERPMYLTTLMTGSTLRFERACIAGGSIGSILLGSLSEAVRFQAQEGPIWARIGILFRIILKFPLSIEGSPLVKVWQRDIGTNVLVFKRYDVVNGAVGGVPGGLAWPQFPAKARTENEIEHGLVFHHALSA